jgi:hypothetical protein
MCTFTSRKSWFIGFFIGAFLTIWIAPNLAFAGNCWINVPNSCTHNIQVNQWFADDYNFASSNQLQCMQRAYDYQSWCATSTAYALYTAYDGYSDWVLVKNGSISQMSLTARPGATPGVPYGSYYWNRYSGLFLFNTGDLALYHNGVALWSSTASFNIVNGVKQNRSCGAGCRAVLKPDGNLELSENGKSYWESHTSSATVPYSGQYLQFHNSAPYVRLTNDAGREVWTSDLPAPNVSYLWTGQYFSPGYDRPKTKNGYEVDLGWGFMQPHIVLHAGDQYAVSWFPCTQPADGRYCAYILKNGYRFSALLNLSEQFIPDGFVGGGSYQPPLLFISGYELFLVYSVFARPTTGVFEDRSILNMVALNVTNPGTWYKRATFENEYGEFTNYLGGAMSNNGEIFIAGYDRGGNHGSAYRLGAFSISPPYHQWYPKQFILGWSDSAFVPSYPHVIIRNDNSAEVLFALANTRACHTENDYNPYKQVMSVRTPSLTQVSPVTLNFSSLSADAAANPQSNGNPCLFRSVRFPTDLFYDSSTDTSYAVVREWDLPSEDLINPYLTDSQQDENFQTHYRVYKNGVEILGGNGIPIDFAQLFGPLSQWSNGKWINSLAISELDSGKFVLIANNSGNVLDLTTQIPIVTTNDFIYFTAPTIFPSGFGTGSSVSLLKPNKNGKFFVPTLHFYAPGQIGSSDGSYLKYNFVNMGF